MLFAHALAAVLALAAISSPLHARQDRTVELLPGRSQFPQFVADPLAPRFSVQKTIGSNDLIGKFGASIPVLDVHLPRAPLQLSIAACATPFLQAPGGGLKMITADFLYSASASVQWNDELSVRLAYGHTSHHLADDAMTGGAQIPLNYSRDYIALECAVLPYHDARVLYAGANYSFHYLNPAKSAKPVWVVVGGVPYTAPLGGGIEVFIGLNIRARQEFEWSTTQNYQVGVEFASPSGRLLRAALEWQMGKDNRGQFYDQPLDITSVGVYFDI